MWWEPRGDTSSIWCDNWSNLGPLHIHSSNVHTCYPMKDTVLWPEYVVDHVKVNLHLTYLSNQDDKTWWTETSNGKFTVKLVWESLRNKKDKVEDMVKLWIKETPFKISFLMWRIWFGNIPVMSTIPVEETIEHLSLKGETATRIWNYFRYASGILDPMLNIKQYIRLWWDVEGNYKVKLIFRVILGITDSVLNLIHTRFNLNCTSNSWPHILAELEQYKPKIGYKIVRWEPLLIIC
ncbi:hypothetical protein H5410_002647 [Solanum commersonii]|uniref:Reverse transcriptase zinc-binding domain-containing protein n=1 Tax=Solanum commersonii TaxID=4109 RepID=A0A9J6B2W7_SOLCO|nr:hypothetical protein H5410_002647 [Solanum commersonii]